MTQKTKSRPNEKDLLELGKKLQDFYETGYINRKQSLWFSFLKGMVSGFGAFLGGTILIGLLLWGLSFFKDIPLLSHVVDAFQHTINK